MVFIPYLFHPRLESSFRSFSRPVLHAAARVVMEMGKSRAAAYALGVNDIDEGTYISSYSDSADAVDDDSNESSQADGIIVYFLINRLGYFYCIVFQ